MSFLGRAKGWLEKRRPAHSDRVTRAAASPSTARVSYNEDHVPLELLEDTSPARAMTFPRDEFMEAAGIKDELYNLCANAGLTRLVTSVLLSIKNSPPISLTVLDIILIQVLLSSKFIMILSP